jgi:hypothetical protein
VLLRSEEPPSANGSSKANSKRSFFIPNACAVGAGGSIRANEPWPKALMMRAEAQRRRESEGPLYAPREAI